MEFVNASDLTLFQRPNRLLLSGYSNSGKSYFVSNLIRKYRSVFSKVIVIGSDLEFVKDLNIIRDDSYDPFSEDFEIDGHILLIFDDIICNPALVKLASKVFIKGRHKNISPIFITQNLFTNDKNFRVLALNVTHIVLFKMRDLRQISFLAKSFLIDSQIEAFINLYKRIVLKKQYGYLLIDYDADLDSKLRIRSNILNEDYERCFVL